MSSESISSLAFGKSQAATMQDIPAQPATFVRAVVVHTLSDPSLRDVKKDAHIIDSLRNREFYLRAPRNSVICRIISDRKGLVQDDDIVCFPFFSSHIMMPIKAGEQVWLFLERPELPYWLSRIPEPLHAEDANFTHGERRLNRDFKGVNDPKNNAPTDDGSGNFTSPRKLTYQNGNPAQPEMAAILGDQTAFLSIMTGSKEHSLVALEPVPRLTKRPGDLVIQGSNNSAIRLGTEMGWSADPAGRPSTSTEKSQASTLPDGQENLSSGLGAIDIVVGRGRYFQDPATEKSATGKSTGTPPDRTTRPYIEETVLANVFETDKNVATTQSENVSKEKGNTRTNPQEGDPDFLMDASRIYVSSKSDIDKLLGSGAGGVARAFENEIQDRSGASIAVKSDHVRIVARKSRLQNRSSVEPTDIENENPSVNGSIRIVKEGEPNTDLATISIEQDGTIHISGSKIFIGRHSQDGGAGSGPGPGESQPFVRYQQLEDLLTSTCQAIIDFATSLKANFGGPANATPGFGGPNPALIVSANAECQKLINDISNIKNNMIEPLKSQRIFGE